MLKPPNNFLGFVILSLGQLVSLTGSMMAGIALNIWVWQETGQASPMALVGIVAAVPAVVLSPLAGKWVDQWNRKFTLMFADTGSVLTTLFLIYLLGNHDLKLWHLYLLSLVSSSFGIFQGPAYAATIGQMLQEHHYGRASGILSFVQAGATLIAPALAGLLLSVTNITTILWIDLGTFAIALLTLFLVHIPQPDRALPHQKTDSVLAGFGYIFSKPHFRFLVMVYVSISFVGAIGNTLIAPMTLARSNTSEIALGVVMTALGVGGVTGSLLMSLWGGPKNRMLGIVLALFGVGTCGYLVLGLGRTVPVWVAGAFGLTLFVPLLSASQEALWLSNSPKVLMGRIFAARQTISNLFQPLVVVATALLADHVFERAMGQAGGLRQTFEPLVGFGPGSGMAVMFLVAGVLAVFLALTFWIRGVPLHRNFQNINNLQEST